MLTFLADLRYGLRLLRQSPGFTAIAICALALGIGANTAIFSTLDAVILRPLPYQDPDRVVMVWEDASKIGFPRNTPSPGNYFDWRAQNHVFTDVAAVRGLDLAVTEDGPPEQIFGQRVTANFFTVLGANPLIGRTFTEDEDRNGVQVAMISYGLWQRRYLGDPSRLNRPIMLNGTKYTVIGVMPRDFVFRNNNRDFWIPMNFLPADQSRRGSHFLSVVARLKPDVTLQRGREEMAAIAKRLQQQYPDENPPTAVVVPIKEDLLGKTNLELVILMCAAGCVLLIACANLASLLLARAVARKRELAVRAALGAGRGRLIRQMVTEAILLSLGGGALGLLLAFGGMKALARLVPTSLPLTAAPSIDLRLLLFTLALSLLTGLLFSIVPAIQASRTSLNDALKQGGRSGTDAGTRNSRDVLVVVEVATALVLLTGAGLMIQTMARLRAFDLQFRPDHLLTMRTSLGPKYSDPVKRLDYFNRVIEQTKALPGVESAAFTSNLPFQTIGNTRGYQIEGMPRDVNFSPDALLRVGTSNYLQTLRVNLHQGRLFDGSETASSAPVIIINETFAHHYWPNGSAIGRRVAFYDPVPVWRTIVGVVADVQERGYDIGMKPAVYAPVTQIPSGWTPDTLVIRTTGDPLAMAPAARRVIASVDPEQPIANLQTMDHLVDLNIADRQQQMTLLGAFAALALLLASIGLYGVLSYAVTQRSREIGLRMALGASASSVVRMIVARGMLLTGAGIVIGLGAAWSATRAMKNLLYGVGATDPITFAAVAALLALIALTACYAPARRASRVDPIVVLREE